MQITLKKVLLVGILILSAVFFFLIVCLPVSRTVTTDFSSIGGPVSTVTYKGSLIGVLSGEQSSLDMVKSQIDISEYVNANAVLSGATMSGLEAYENAVKALTTVYKVFAVLGIILFVSCILAAIGAFFIPSMKGARGLTLPFFITNIILSLVVAIFATMLVVSTKMAEAAANSQYIKVSTTAGVPWLMWSLGLLAFIGALVSSGAVRDVVFVGKKK